MATVDLEKARSAQPKPTPGLTAADVPIHELSNDSLIVRLHFTINHLSRWLTPIHDRSKLERGRHYGQPSVRDLMFELRDFELATFPKLHAIANVNNPDLDKLPPLIKTPEQAAEDERIRSLSIMAEFRRLRQGTVALLRALPDAAWNLVGTSRREHDWQIRELGELLVSHDTDVLYQIDLTLDQVGARVGVSAAGRAHLDELLRMVPVTKRVIY
jgi:hypothetical protein